MTAKETRCVWTEDMDGWETGCGERWEFTTGGPKENGAKFCPYCGGHLVAQPGGEEGK